MDALATVALALRREFCVYRLKHVAHRHPAAEDRREDVLAVSRQLVHLAQDSRACLMVKAGCAPIVTFSRLPFDPGFW